MHEAALRATQSAVSDIGDSSEGAVAPSFTAVTRKAGMLTRVKALDGPESSRLTSLRDSKTN
jgi:hypothetical protein